MPAMNREPNSRRPLQPVRHHLSRIALVLVASLAGAPLAHAASFRCPQHASASERLVCSDPNLSTLDDQLAALYRNAVNATPDTTALEADRVSQWQWRQHNCKDKACVTDWYDRRIAELEADLEHGRQASAQRVRTEVVEQQLTPAAQGAVLELKGIDTAPPAPRAQNNAAPLHLRKMPSGVAADARQKRLAQAQTAAQEGSVTEK
jgi:uncharacterized protein